MAEQAFSHKLQLRKAVETDVDSQTLKGVISFTTYVTPPSNEEGPLFVFHHGAGSSALTFTATAIALKQEVPEAGFLAYDARGHGTTSIELDPSVEDPAKRKSITEAIEYNMSLATFTKDLEDVIRLTIAEFGWKRTPSIVLVGHSLGGAVIVELASRRVLGQSLLGFAVIDVVEGSAIELLRGMRAYFSTRPPGFLSLESALKWHAKTGTIRNKESAAISVPPILVELQQDKFGMKYAWRTDLMRTEPFWMDWFQGLSQKFLSSPSGKLLLLAGTDRLDKPLMIGQMQGKYQLQVYPEAGHFVQEDVPIKTAEILAEFYRRNDRSLLILPPKVSDMPKNDKGLVS